MGNTKRSHKRLKAMAKRPGAGRRADLLSEDEERQLLEQGFVVLPYSTSGKAFMRKDSGEALIDEVLASGVNIFNNEMGNSKGGDGTRLQKVMDMAGPHGVAASRIAKRLIRTFPFLVPGKAAFLVSTAHGHDQLPHADIADISDPVLRSSILEKNQVPLAVVLTFNQPGHLNVWPGSHEIVWAEDEKEDGSEDGSEDMNQHIDKAIKKGDDEVCVGRRIEIPPYHALVFRQDLVHAGTAYESDSLRMHFYLNIAGHVIAEDATLPVDETYFVMQQPS